MSNISFLCWKPFHSLSINRCKHTYITFSIVCTYMILYHSALYIYNDIMYICLFIYFCYLHTYIYIYTYVYQRFPVPCLSRSFPLRQAARAVSHFITSARKHGVFGASAVGPKLCNEMIGRKTTAWWVCFLSLFPQGWRTVDGWRFDPGERESEKNGFQAGQAAIKATTWDLFKPPI